jgi:glycosyltransferase involved in cell wall biosynthesis
VVHLGNKFPVTDRVDPDGRDGFLFVGTIEPGKNLPLVLEAFARFRAGSGGGLLRVAGAMGWKQSGLPALIDSLGIADAVEFLGYVPDADLPALYARSIALIQASTYEGFGLPVIEAMASGCPVISARNSGLIEAGGDAALFFQTNDREGLEERMSALAGDRALRERCIRLGCGHARKFTWEKTAREALEVYRKAMDL